MTHRTRASVVAVAALLLIAIAGLAAGGCGEDKKLKVTGIEPNTGDHTGGERITIKGNRFTKDGTRTAKVFFGDAKAEVKGFRGDDELIVMAPPGEIGKKVDVLIVFEPGGEITLKEAFTFVQRTQADVGDLDTSKKK
jgi:hypothetical protein